MLYNLFENRDFVSVFAVALLAEGVDRNWRARLTTPASMVALLAEGVDRNWDDDGKQPPDFSVALLAEGVDRNYEALQIGSRADRRPPRGGRG